MTKGNRTKAGVILDPRQALFLQYYLDPKSETFNNGMRSAIRAGYEEEYSSQLIAKMPEWLENELKYLGMVNRAEKNLKNALEMEIDRPVVLRNGTVLMDKDGNPVLLRDIDFLKVQMDVSKFVAERLSKIRWSARQEHTGKDGESLVKTDDELSRRIEALEERASQEGSGEEGSERLALSDAGDSVSVGSGSEPKTVGEST